VYDTISPPKPIVRTAVVSTVGTSNGVIEYAIDDFSLAKGDASPPVELTDHRVAFDDGTVSACVAPNGSTPDPPDNETVHVADCPTVTMVAPFRATVCEHEVGNV
jgi:hypothetical protein